ncbi:hypothetical protein VR7878_01351 [Vibrio ruber DSM 16370]|uniref:Uncharacterized protein n=1 Tax=Vibrio ruber (strain DSM 16370 / JCM 11486 / BCRC 17186 / CECT 7878 / LMG 23124 / VR1) TaxID=1123498 RepID=A0A1R4LGX4_VIBR1|nr:hypothetical protein VR7878_01351 [Vibrio ruber DSM 16370]
MTFVDANDFSDYAPFPFDRSQGKNIRLEKLIQCARFHDEICFSRRDNFDQYMI